MIQWNDPPEFIQGLTAPQRKAVKALGLATIHELLELFPRRYDDYSRLVPIAQIPDGVPVTIRGRIKEIGRAPTFRQSFVLIKAIIEDESGSIGVTWFNQPWLVKTLVPGTDIFMSGVVTKRPRFGRGFTSPLWEPATAETLAAGTVAPVYPLNGNVTLRMVRVILKMAVEQVQFPEDWVPISVRAAAQVCAWDEAYRGIHRPAKIEDAERARQRFAFGELFSYQLALRVARRDADTAGAPQVPFDEAYAKIFVSKLPFELTDDQKKAIWAVVKDMDAGRPMRRLLQGDVGSGKTVVAAMLAALVFRSGQSAALMAPTDLLAKQHFGTLKRFLVPHGISLLLRTGSTRILLEGAEEKTLNAEQATERVSRGRVVCVGTHALIEPGAAPPDLALAIVDEQHRFGVSQREALAVTLRKDGLVPHLLSMSATPIPRSLALTLFGDLDVSIISTKPQGRKPIETHVYGGEMGREEAYQRIREEVSQGNQAFIVCPLIDESDTLGVKSVEAETRRLQQGPLRGIRVGMVHGRMTTKDKDAAMQSFVEGKTDVLVATTVVEVGVDVPRATVMLIEGAERFGLAQLHQLRGRVGRSSKPSYCLLVASDDAGPTMRLHVLEETNDGFAVAEADLRMRGEGNLMGLQQSGEALFRSARLDDLSLMTRAREQSALIFDQDPQLEKYPLLKDVVVKLQESSHGE